MISSFFTTREETDFQEQNYGKTTLCVMKPSLGVIHPQSLGS